MTDAKAHAERQYEKFKTALATQRHEEADKMIAEIKSTIKALPRDKKSR